LERILGNLWAPLAALVAGKLVMAPRAEEFVVEHKASKKS
jgi:hypothetical protein